MNIIEACNMLGISDINNEDESSLKKKYKKLMIKYHPDNIGENNMAYNISEAYITLSKINEIKNRMSGSMQSEVNVIDLDELIELTGSSNAKFKDKMCKNPFIIINTRYMVDGEWKVAVNIVKYNIYGRYTIDIEITTNSVNGNPVSIMIGGKKYDSLINSTMKIWTVNISKDIEITYKIRSVVR